MQFNGERTIHVDLLNVVRTSSSYSQLGWVVHFLQNFLTRSVVMLMLLPLCAAKVVIDILFAAASYCLPVRYQRDIQEHVMAKYESPWHGAECGGYCDLHGMHCSHQSLLLYSSDSCNFKPFFLLGMLPLQHMSVLKWRLRSPVTTIMDQRLLCQKACRRHTTPHRSRRVSNGWREYTWHIRHHWRFPWSHVSYWQPNKTSIEHVF